MAEINEYHTKDTMNQWVKSWFFAKINKINNPLAKLTKRRKEENWIRKIRDEKANIIVNINEVQKVIWDYFKNLYSNKMENEEIDKFLDTVTHQNWTKSSLKA
jgi:hypothetical protein